MSVQGDENATTWEGLIERAINNDQMALAELYNRTYSQGYSVARQMVKSEQDAMDIMQEAYISAFKNLDTIREPEKFRNWFNCIVANKCRDYLRKHKDIVFSDMLVENDIEFEDTLESDLLEFSPDESVDYSETKRLVAEILQGLSQEQKLCILMYYYNELSVKEIAATLHCSENTVKSRLNYARKKIKNDVKALEKKGTKLYSITPIPFLVWMLRNMEKNTQSSALVWDVVSKEVFSHPAAAGGGISSGTLSPRAAAGVCGTKAAIGKVATETTKVGLRAVTKHILVGIVCTSLVAGGIYGVTKGLGTGQSVVLSTEDTSWERAGSLLEESQTEETIVEGESVEESFMEKTSEAETSTVEETTEEETTEMSSTEEETMAEEETAGEETSAEETIVEETTEAETTEEETTEEETTEEETTEEETTEEETTEEETTEEETTEEETTEEETTEEETTVEETTEAIADNKGTVENPYQIGETIVISENAIFNPAAADISGNFHLNLTVTDSFSLAEALAMTTEAYDANLMLLVAKATLTITGDYAGTLEAVPFHLMVMTNDYYVHSLGGFLWDESFNQISSVNLGTEYVVGMPATYATEDTVYSYFVIEYNTAEQEGKRIYVAL